MIKYTAERDPRSGYAKAIRVLGRRASTNETRLFRHAVAPLPTVTGSTKPARVPKGAGAVRGGKYA